MPKMKTHKSGAKRYKVTATGKITRRKAGIGHSYLEYFLYGNSFETKSTCEAAISVVLNNFLFLLADLFASKCPIPAFLRVILPVAVTL